MKRKKVEEIFFYCKKCGLIKNIKANTAMCPACEIPLIEVPSEYLSSSGMMFASQAKRKELEEMIKNGDEFDVQANLEKDDVINEKEELHKAEVQKRIDEYNNSETRISCPICNSKRISEISNVGKIVKVGAFGILGAGDIGKKYKCNTCGCKF